MIQAANLQNHFGDQVLFEDVTFQVSYGERVGLVGRNGSGKSTLFRMIDGDLEPDAGVITVPKGYRIVSLEQHIKFSKPTVIEECCQVLEEDQQYDFFRAEKILFGLGFTQDDLERDPYEFSGGYQIRINLCKALVQSPDMLLLDEPTNYLDIVSLRWLKGFLRNFDGEVVLITHDRDFMDAVATHIMGISRKRLKKTKGDTAKFYEQLIMEDEIYEQTRMNQEKKRDEMQGFVDRFKAKASKARQAQSKMKMIEKMGSMDALASESNLSFKFHHKECPGKVILEAKNLGFAYTGEDQDQLFSGLNLTIGKNDRIGIIGKNGKGKSTLLNVLGGELTATNGTMTNHPSLSKGHFGQTNVERLYIKHSISQEIRSSNPKLGHTEIRSICGAMMFQGDLADKKIEVLSGGERSRVLLGKILAHPTNLLLLDEPTNHLDIESVEALSDEISRYPGALLIVTHSEYLLRNLVNKLIIFHEGRADYFIGTYDDFLNKIGWESEETFPKKKKKGLNKKELQKKRQELIREKSKTCKPLKSEMDLLEKEIVDSEALLEGLNNDLEKFTAEADGDAIVEVTQKIGKLHFKIQDAFEKLSPISEEYETKEKEFDLLLSQLQGE